MLLAEDAAQLPARAIPRAAERTEQGSPAGSLGLQTPGQTEVAKSRAQQELCWHACMQPATSVRQEFSGVKED